jgi:UPF0755 protein
MKKFILIALAVLVIGAAILAWLVIGVGTGFSGKKETLYIRSDASTREAVMDSLRSNKIINNETVFNFLAGRMGYWNKIKPGKYEISKGSSLLSIVRKLRNGQQTPVDLVIKKLRTQEDFARLTGNKFEFDSADMMQYLNHSDLLKKHEINSNEAMGLVLPDTYRFFWNTTPEKVFNRLADETQKFWTEERKQKAAAKGFTALQITTIASIVEEETNAQAEKGNVASVYINRMKKGMPLQADPTVKFALKDFGLKRIYHKHLEAESPYNTYRVKGLPPGPICTPSKKTIDAVLNAPETNYYYFVASPQFNGTHEFSATYEEHLKKARIYQEALNQLEASRKQ